MCIDLSHITICRTESHKRKHSIYFCYYKHRSNVSSGIELFEYFFKKNNTVYHPNLSKNLFIQKEFFLLPQKKFMGCIRHHLNFYIFFIKLCLNTMTVFLVLVHLKLLPMAIPLVFVLYPLLLV